MPVFSHDGHWIYFAGLLVSKGGEMDIYRIPAQGGVAEKVLGASEPGVFEYYPVTKENGFFFARNTPSNPADQIYFKNTITGAAPVPMPFNTPGYDFSDPTVIDKSYT